MSVLEVGAVVDVSTLAVTHEPVAVEAVREGSPTTALLPLATVGDTEVGVWEMTPGTATDIEVDEVFVVISGAASIRFVAPELPSIEVGPGSIVRLTDGMHTVWTVTETLRKVYVA